MMPDHSSKEVDLQSWSLRCFLDAMPERGGHPLPEFFATALDVSHEDHLAVQSIAQGYIDGSISKTINFAADVDLSAFEEVYDLAHEWGCKSLSVYRPNPVRGQILSNLD